MQSKLFKAMKVKKKREVDPNAPPRPNLLSHEKTIKDMKVMDEKAMHYIRKLEQSIADLKRKYADQTAYLQALHSRITNKK